MKKFSLVLFSLALSAAACAAAPKPFMMESSAVTQASGTISAIGKSVVCMDDADYALHLHQNNLRLKARDDKVARELAQAAKSGKPVIIIGHDVLGPECNYLHVDNVLPMAGTPQQQTTPHIKR